ncbi:major facilitator superfamily domain-containing protein [Exophiala viscosa]|uniref:major facilitator superfamily domain-containing protein n=1 Tax=Exophiala viscosa TaxID=2486360 RepID=UPI00219A0137|nr:major facilitator superfamily domain-containing protein [Exophiala viscosa]
MAPTDETSRLLPPLTDEQRQLAQQESTVENGPAEYGGIGSAIRRHSSAHLPPFHEEYPSSEEPSSTLAIWTVVPILLIGVFVANADGSLVIASSQHIASEFHELSKASWLVTSFMLAVCASQPLYGKLSDIFGRKANLVVSYVFFAAGCFLCGIGRQYWHVLAGRAISGIGGAGMTALVSIIIADMVPVRSVAAWRSYVNVAATLGRSLGGPVGGWLTDTIGWRWSFYGQCPLTLIGLLLILWKLPHRTNHTSKDGTQSFSEKLRRVDFVGALVLAAAICAFLLVLQSFTNDMPWYFALAAGLSFLALIVLFVVIERHWVSEPIVPLGLIIRRDTLTPYMIAGAQMAAQFAMFYSVPIYFQIAHYSVSAAGLRLVPAVVGNAIGGLLSGYIISETGRYKALTILASAAASIGYLLILIRWHGTTHWAELIYFSLGGFGSGIIQSTSFVHLAASLDQSEIAIAGTILYLAQNIFVLVGIQVATAVLQGRLRVSLEHDLGDVKDRAKIIEQAISSIDYIWDMPPLVRKLVVRAYFNSLTYSYGVSISFAVVGLCIGLTLKARKL